MKQINDTYLPPVAGKKTRNRKISTATQRYERLQ